MSSNGIFPNICSEHFTNCENSTFKRDQHKICNAQTENPIVAHFGWQNNWKVGNLAMLFGLYDGQSYSKSGWIHAKIQRHMMIYGGWGWVHHRFNLPNQLLKMWKLMILSPKAFETCLQASNIITSHISQGNCELKWRLFSLRWAKKNRFQQFILFDIHFIPHFRNIGLHRLLWEKFSN